MIEIQRHCSCHLFSGFNIRVLNFTGKEYSSPGLHGVLLSPFILPAGGWYLRADEITLILWWLSGFLELFYCKQEAKKEFTATSKTKDLHKMKEMRCNFSEIILWKLSLVLSHSRTIKRRRKEGWVPCKDVRSLIPLTLFSSNYFGTTGHILSTTRVLSNRLRLSYCLDVTRVNTI